MLVKFTTTPEEGALIKAIADRAQSDLGMKTRLDIQMDVAAVHCNGCPLKLKELLEADDFNFAHDLIGIASNIDRTTGTLQNCFLPRFHGKVKAA